MFRSAGWYETNSPPLGYNFVQALRGIPKSPADPFSSDNETPTKHGDGRRGAEAMARHPKAYTPPPIFVPV